MTQHISNNELNSLEGLKERNNAQYEDIPPIDSQTADKTSAFSVALISALPHSSPRDPDKSPRISSGAMRQPQESVLDKDAAALSENKRFEIERGIQSSIPDKSEEHPQTPPHEVEISIDGRGPFQSPGFNPKVKVRKKEKTAQKASTAPLSSETHKKTGSAPASSQSTSSN